MLSEQARLKHGKESTNLLIAACAKYQKAYNVDKTNFDLLYNWGHAVRRGRRRITGKKAELIDSFSVAFAREA